MFALEWQKKFKIPWKFWVALINGPGKEYFKKVMKKTMHSIFSSFSTVMSSGFFTIKKVDQVCRVVCHSVLEWKSQYERANPIDPTNRFIIFLGSVFQTKMNFWYLSAPIWLRMIILNIIWYNLSKIFGCYSFWSTKS